MRRLHLWLPLILVIAVAAEVVLGFFRFVDQVPQAPDSGITRPGAVDAIAVLTGGSGRIEAALDILAALPDAQLFVSGVYRDTDIAQLISRARPGADFDSAKITLGHEAVDTRGNARETALWVEEKGIRRLALVTGAYHMPRAEVLFRRAMPAVTLLRYPVITPNVPLASWWRYWGTTRLLIGEYAKLRFSRLGL